MVKAAKSADAGALAELAVRLWEGHTVRELEAEFAELLEQDTCACFLLFQEDAEDCPVGFAQCQLRFDYVEGTKTSPVGYLEGIYVDEDCRRRGGGLALLQACEKWAAKKGCAEFASDCELDNELSYMFHRSAGFAEANRIICFTKKIAL